MSRRARVDCMRKEREGARVCVSLHPSLTLLLSGAVAVAVSVFVGEACCFGAGGLRRSTRELEVREVPVPPGAKRQGECRWLQAERLAGRPVHAMRKACPAVVFRCFSLSRYGWK